MIKTRYILFLLLVLNHSVHAADMHNVDELVKTFRSTMESKDTKIFSNILDNTVEITYNNQHSNFSKGQAILILQDFLDKNTPNNFKIEYQGVSNQKDEHYVLGTAKTNSGSYKIFLYIKKKDGKYVIQELKIDK